MKIPACRDRQEGQTTVEYALIVAALALLLIVAVLALALKVGDVFREGGEAATPTRPVGEVQCDSNYSGACVPPYPPDLDCSDLRSLGIGQVTIVGADPHGLDPDGDGVGCD